MTIPNGWRAHGLEYLVVTEHQDSGSAAKRAMLTMLTEMLDADAANSRAPLSLPAASPDLFSAAASATASGPLLPTCPVWFPDPGETVVVRVQFVRCAALDGV